MLYLKKMVQRYCTKIFLGFNNEKNLIHEEILKDLLRYEYLNFNKKRGIPNFLYINIAKEE